MGDGILVELVGGILDGEELFVEKQVEQLQFQSNTGRNIYVFRNMAEDMSKAFYEFSGREIWRISKLEIE